MQLRAARDPNQQKPFERDDLEKIFSEIRSRDPAFTAELNNVRAAIDTGAPLKAPSFDTPEKQLVWGAALGYLSINPQVLQAWNPPAAEGAMVSQTSLWKQISNTKIAYNELLSHAHHVRGALRDKNTKYSWGDPGVGFTFDRQKNHIQIDLMQSMIVGFEHARADVYREIGQSLLSVSYPKRMQQIYRDMQPLLKKMKQAQDKKGPQLKPDEYKQLRMLSAEWELRHMMFAAAEENTANRFVANMGLQDLQDYGVSLNNTAVTFRNMGLTRVPKKGDASEELRSYMNLCNAVQLSFFQNNDFFADNDNAWMGVGVDTAMVRKTTTLAQRPDGQKTDKDGINHPDFQYLRALCGGPIGLENLQPKSHERLYGWQTMTSRIQKMDADRKSIIEEIWNLYAENLIQAILKQVNDQIDQQMKDAQKNQDQKQDSEDQDQDGEDQDGQDQEGQEGQQGQQGQGQGKGKKGKPQKDQKPQKQKKDRNRPQGEEQDPDGDQQDGDGQDGQDQDGEKQDGQKGDKKDKAESKLGADDEQKVPVEGVGDMDAPEAPTEMPGDEMDPNGSANDADGEDADGQDADGQDGDAQDGEDADADGESVEDIEKALQDMEDAEQEADGDSADADGEGQGQGKGKKSDKNGKGKQPGQGAGKDKGESLKELSEKSWLDYNQRIAELAGPIARVRKLFQDVQERQLQRKTTVSKDLDILPENGELKDRFNAEAHRDFTIKKAIGNVEENDLKRFHKDQVKMVPTEIDIVIAIDGSGSMNGVPLNSALQASAIMYEAAAGKDMKMNVYVMLWGPDNPPVIIKPGDDRATIGKAMEAARKGLSSGTALAPAIKKIAETIGDTRGKAGTLSGFTHVLIVSDGDMFDPAPSLANVQTVFNYADKVTFDTAIITNKSGSSMEKMSKDIKGNKPYQDFGVVLGNDPEQVPMSIVGLLLDKVRKCGSFVAVPNSKKRRAMKNAHNKMDKKP